MAAFAPFDWKGNFSMCINCCSISSRLHTQFQPMFYLCALVFCIIVRVNIGRSACWVCERTRLKYEIYCSKRDTSHTHTWTNRIPDDLFIPHSDENEIEIAERTKSVIFILLVRFFSLQSRRMNKGGCKLNEAKTKRNNYRRRNPFVHNEYCEIGEWVRAHDKCARMLARSTTQMMCGMQVNRAIHRILCSSQRATIIIRISFWWPFVRTYLYFEMRKRIRFVCISFGRIFLSNTNHGDAIRILFFFVPSVIISRASASVCHVRAYSQSQYCHLIVH